jgi:colicin import membrane protein
MKQSLYIGPEPAFYKIVIASAVLHVLFIIFVTVPVRTKEKEYKNYFVNLVGPAEVRRPLKAARGKEPATHKTITEKSPAKDREALKIKPSSEKIDIPKKGVSLEPEKTAERVSREIERLQALKSLSAKKKQKEERIEKGRRNDEEVAQAIEIIRKNKLGDVSKGQGLPGAQSSEDVNLYITMVQQKIWDHWIHPEFSSEELEAVMSFQIDRKGNIISPKIVQSSGNVLFDRSAMKAILKAGPLPPPSVEDEFVVRFHL